MRIGFFGTGNMGSALIRGIINSGFIAPDNISSYDVDEEKNNAVKNKYNINVQKSIFDVVDNSDILVAGVKPNQMQQLIMDIRDYLDKKCLVSIAAGKSLAFMEEYAGKDKSLVRVMPNTPAVVNSGAFAVAFNENVAADQKEFVMNLFSSCGLAIEIADSYMDAVTGLSGSGPAYIFILIDAMADGAVRAGLPRDIAIKLAAQTVMGAGKMVIDTKYHPDRLKDMVTSPAGTTIEGVSILEKNAFRGSVIEAVYGAYLKAKELS